MKGKFTGIEEYLAALPEDQRGALELLRKRIKVAAPGAVEGLGYGMPAFRLYGKLLVLFGAARHHCALYPMSASTVATHQTDLKDFDTSKGTIRFQPDKPLPAVLVRKLVESRIVELAEQGKHKPNAGSEGSGKE